MLRLNKAFAACSWSTAKALVPVQVDIFAEPLRKVRLA
jgi:hypothetical protein